jgi:hypothetical protein
LPAGNRDSQINSSIEKYPCPQNTPFLKEYPGQEEFDNDKIKIYLDLTAIFFIFLSLLIMPGSKSEIQI